MLTARIVKSVGVDWDLVDKNKDLLRFVKSVIAFTQKLAIFTSDILITLAQTCDEPHVIWHGTKLYHPDWGSDSHSLACTMHDAKAGERLHLMMNSYWERADFRTARSRRERSVVSSHRHITLFT